MKINSVKVKYLLIILLFAFIICEFTFSVAAHKVILYAYVEGQNIVVEGGFGDGSIARNAEVKVYDSQDNLLDEGISNDNGIYEFKIPEKTNLKIVLNAGMGHQAEYTITEDELPELSNRNNKPVEEEGKVTGLNEEQLRTIISQELDKKIGPINKKLIQMENSKGPGITEILGGIGYIFGIMGIALYFVKRRNKS